MHTSSPCTAAMASMRGSTAKSLRTLRAGYGRMGSQTSGAAGAGLLRGVPGGDPGQKQVDLKITRMKDHHVVVVSQFFDRGQGGVVASHGY